MGPCKLIDGHTGFGLGLLSCFCKNILNHVPDYTTSLPRPHYESSQPWAPQILCQKILRQTDTGGNVSLGKLNYRRTVCFIQTEFNIMNFSQLCVRSISYFVCTISIKTHFMIRTTYGEFQCSTKIISQ